LAQARSNSYRLLGQLYREGLTAVSLPYVQQIPELSAVTPEPFNADAAAASHHELFQLNVFAYESFFLSEDGLVGGEKTAVVQQHFSQQGYAVPAAQTEVDHLGQQLTFLAFLTAREANAWESSNARAATVAQNEQLSFLKAHLLRWMVPCLLAVQAQSDAFFGEVVHLTQGLVLEHFETLLETAVSPPPSFLPPTKNILADDKTGFKEITHYLLLPAFSGIYLSRGNIGQLARQFKLPRGFGSREQMLVNLLRTAVQYEALTTLLTALQETCQDWQADYQQLADAYPDAAPFIHPWQVRAAATEQLLAELMAPSIAD
jgi:TorA maturation chaperone TorD